MTTQPQTLRLITIPMSHYCEKARWALERLHLPYYEERHLQLFHYPRTWWTSGGPSVPVLLDGNEVIADSTRILQHLDRYAPPGQRLYPEDPGLCTQVMALEDEFDEILGVESRRWVYHHYRHSPVRALQTAAQGAPAYEKWLAPLVYPLFQLLINKLMDPSAEKVTQGLIQVRNIIQRTDRLLEAGHRYLLGNEFTAADLALAAMLAPLVLPRNYGIRLPEMHQAPKAAQGDVQYFRDTATGRYVLRLYENERIGSATAPESQPSILLSQVQ